MEQFVARHFARWDRNHDGILVLEEVDHKVMDPSVRGYEAAVIVRIRQRMTAKGNQPQLSRGELLSLAGDRTFGKLVTASRKQLETIDRELFLPTDPNLSTFSQGRLGDCYLLCVIAAQVHRSPKAIRNMIRPKVTGGFQVVFGDGQKVQVAALTDCELLLGARLDSHHGSWLAVLEKAYGIIREHDRARRATVPPMSARRCRSKPLTAVAPPPIISLLTGRRAGSSVSGQNRSS